MSTPNLLEAAWDLDPKLQEVRDELEKLGAGDELGLYLSEIEHGAKDAKQIALDLDRQKSAEVLVELNKLLRSLKRMITSRPAMSGRKISRRLAQLSPTALTFVRMELGHNLGQETALDKEDWSNLVLRKALASSVNKSRHWLRAERGPIPQMGLHQFCHNVMFIYKQITGKSPGVGNNAYDTGSPFEKLWLASLKLINPNATMQGAREIFRSTSGRR
jgi:hypothetical protein